MSGCGNRGHRPDEFPCDGIVAVGFGTAGLFCDGELVIDGEARAMDDNFLTGAECERIAAADPDRKWEIELFGPLSGATYARQRDGRWIVTERNEGFA